LSDPALFYTGLVAPLYTPLRSESPDAAPYLKFVKHYGEPALELGCGTGDPILALRAAGLDVDGIDASADMLAVAAQRAEAEGLEVTLVEARMETLDLARRYRSIYLAGPTFNLLPDDATALAALQRIRAHLDDDGCALVPLHIPEVIDDEYLGRWREGTDDAGRTIRFCTVGQARDEAARLQTTRLRYERVDGDETEATERDFVIHWYTPEQFGALANEAGLRVTRQLDFGPGAFAFWLIHEGGDGVGA
jgi:SAM-dependent methyltransferase